MKKFNPLTAVFVRRKIQDPVEHLLKFENAPMKPSLDNDVRMRGSVHMMKNRRITRQDVDVGFKKLRHL